MSGKKKKPQKRRSAAGTKKAAGKRAPTPASWKPGQSGNPKGRPPDAEIQRVRNAFKGDLETARKTLVHVMEHSPDDKARVAAAREVLDRIMGKARSSLDLEALDVEKLPDRKLNVFVLQAIQVVLSQQEEPDPAVQELLENLPQAEVAE